MLAGMTVRIFQEWQEYDRIEPFGEQREELRHGQKMAQYANYHRDWEKFPEPATCWQFMNFTEQPEPTEEPETDPDELSAQIATELFRM